VYHKKNNILVIAEDPDAREVYESILKPRGYQSQFVTNITQIFDKKVDFFPDLIIWHLDWYLRGNVQDLMVEMHNKMSKSSQFVPILLVTEADWLDPSIRSLVASISGFPFPIEDFLQTVDNLLQ
jgi:DNA-binding NtrC family response regulator